MEESKQKLIDKRQYEQYKTEIDNNILKENEKLTKMEQEIGTFKPKLDKLIKMNKTEFSASGDKKAITEKVAEELKRLKKTPKQIINKISGINKFGKRKIKNSIKIRSRRSIKKNGNNQKKQKAKKPRKKLRRGRSRKKN